MEPVSILVKSALALKKLEHLSETNSGDLSPLDLVLTSSSATDIASNLISPEALNALASNSRELEISTTVRLWDRYTKFRELTEEKVQSIVMSDPTLHSWMKDLATNYRNCRSDQDFQKFYTKANGRLSKHIMPMIETIRVEKEFSPLFESVKTEPPVLLEGKGLGQNSSRIDILFCGAKQPIIGQGMYIRPGEALAVELKTGSIKYLQKQVQGGHLAIQIAAHHEITPHSLVMVNDSIRGSAIEPELRQTIKGCGSNLVNLFDTQALKNILMEQLKSGVYA